MIDWDGQISRTHAHLERIGRRTVADDGLSSNGTFVNEERVGARRRLHDADVLRLGHTRLLFRAPVPGAGRRRGRSERRTDRRHPPRAAALLALCRPAMQSGLGAAPSTNEEIAADLHLSVQAVKAHLRLLFRQFGIGDLPQNQKRLRLRPARARGRPHGSPLSPAARLGGSSSVALGFLPADALAPKTECVISVSFGEGVAMSRSVVPIAQAGQGSASTVPSAPSAPRSGRRASAVRGGPALEAPNLLFIGGRWRAAQRGRTLAVENPADGLAIADVADASPVNCLRALAAAAGAAAGWRRTPARERARALRRGGEILRDDAERLALVLSLESGKPLDEAREEVVFAAEYLEWNAEEACRISGRVHEHPDGGAHFVVTRRPVGPCLVISPWNFPFAIPARGVAPRSRRAAP